MRRVAWYEPQAHRPFWHSFVLGALMMEVAALIGVGFVLGIVACGLAGVVLGHYDHTGS